MTGVWRLVLCCFRLWPDSFEDFLYTFGMLSGGYVCHFNVLAAHRELTEPTQDRIKRVVHMTMAGSMALYIVIAVFGYVYAHEMACDDILQNFCHTDWLINVGRIMLVCSFLRAPRYSTPLLAHWCTSAFVRACTWV